MTRQYFLWESTQKTQKHLFAKFMHPCVHCSFTHSGQDMETTKCPSVDDWMKMWSIYTMEYCSAIRKDDIPPFATPWMDLENITLSEISQSEMAKNHMISLTWGHKTETHRHRQQHGGFQGEGEGASKG